MLPWSSVFFKYFNFTSNNICAFLNLFSIKLSPFTLNLVLPVGISFYTFQTLSYVIDVYRGIGAYNELNLVVPDGAFMYPFYIKNGAELRKVLQQKNIFIPILWPNVCNLCNENELEYDMAKNILPLPIDQRYEEEDMEYMINEIMLNAEPWQEWFINPYWWYFEGKRQINGV